LELLEEIGIDVKSFGFKSVITADTVKLVNTSTTTVFKDAQEEQEYSLALANRIESRYTNFKGKTIKKISLNDHSTIHGITFSNGCLRFYDNVNYVQYTDSTYT
jgi:hypothetical protein